MHRNSLCYIGKKIFCLKDLDSRSVYLGEEMKIKMKQSLKNHFLKICKSRHFIALYLDLHNQIHHRKMGNGSNVYIPLSAYKLETWKDSGNSLKENKILVSGMIVFVVSLHFRFRLFWY